MIRRWLTFACGAAALFVSAGAALAGGINWKSDFAAAKAEAKKSHKLLFVDFYADW
ncbi:MAG TPA: hypothetical protein VKT77_09755 [Chthonomonadaceae bacterium]|nr:hypothetical protein [Chthonomonadaceae bacterium]